MLEFYIPQIFRNARAEHPKLKKLKPYSLLYEIRTFQFRQFLQTLSKLHLNKIKLKNTCFPSFLMNSYLENITENNLISVVKYSKKIKVTYIP